MTCWDAEMQGGERVGHICPAIQISECKDDIDASPLSLPSWIAEAILPPPTAAFDRQGARNIVEPDANDCLVNIATRKDGGAFGEHFRD